MVTFVQRWSTSTLARNTVWMFLGQGLRLLIQAGYFIIIAHRLGAEQYGAFMAVTALVAILSPFIGVGTDKLLIKHVARNREVLDEYFGNGFLMNVVTGCLGVVLVFAISSLLLPSTIARSTVLMVGLADLIFYRIINLAACAFQALEKLSRTAEMHVLVSATRFLGIASVVLLRIRPTAEAWSFIYAAATAVAALLCGLRLRAIIEHWKFSLRKLKQEVAEGFFFSASESAKTINNDVDKTMLARLSTLDANGIYAAAYRLVDVSFIPVSSLIWAAYPAFFRHGQNRIKGAYAYARQLLPRSLAFSSLVCIGLIIGAPVVPRILGAQYIRTVEALRWLAILPLFKTVQYFLADSLTGAGHQGLRTLLQAAVAILNVLVNLWIIPRYSWRGAAWSSIASDDLLALSLWLATVILHEREITATRTLSQLSPSLLSDEPL